MGSAALVDGVMAAALEERRDRYNAVVADARRGRADFDTGALERQLRGPVRAVVEAAETAAPGSGSRVLAALFEPVVHLVGQRRLDGGTHDELLDALPGMARVLVDDPRLVFGSLANALVHLRSFGIPTAAWLQRVVRAADGADAATALTAGQVAAWALGLAHYRASALEAAATLPSAALGAALGAPEPLPPKPTLTHLRQDRWWRPEQDPPAEATVVHRVGGFRGFGGPFLAPPRLAADQGHVTVRSGTDVWALHADAFGATLTRGTDGGIADSGTRVTVGDVTAVVVPTSYEVLVVAPAP